MNRTHIIRFAAAAALGLLGSATTARAGYDYESTASPPEPRPCDLTGVNPAYHPEIFGNPAVARSFGFAQSADGSWHSICGAGGARASAEGPPVRRAPRHRSRVAR